MDREREGRREREGERERGGEGEREREKKEIILLHWNGIHMRFYFTKCTFGSVKICNIAYEQKKVNSW